jgi:hypothetical protein
VLDTQFVHDFRERFNVRSQQIHGRVDHLNQICGMTNKILGFQKFGRVRFNVQAKAKQNFGFRATLEESVEKKRQDKTNNTFI